MISLRRIQRPPQTTTTTTTAKTTLVQPTNNTYSLSLGVNSSNVTTNMKLVGGMVNYKITLKPGVGSHPIM